MIMEIDIRRDKGGRRKTGKEKKKSHLKIKLQSNFKRYLTLRANRIKTWSLHALNAINWSRWEKRQKLRRLKNGDILQLNCIIFKYTTLWAN